MQRSLYYIYIVAKNSIGQRKKLIFQMVNHTVFLFFSLYLYKHIYEILPKMGARLPLANAIWSMAAYYIIFWLGLRQIERTFRDDIKSGNIETYLLRPISYIWQKVLNQIGQGVLPCLFAFVLSFGVCMWMVGLPILDVPVYIWILLTFVLFIASQVLLCLIFILCGLSGFWLDNSEPVNFVVSKFIMVLGGAWVPVAFFPHALQLFAKYSPFGGSMAITYAMYPNLSQNFLSVFLNILFWILLCGVLTVVVSKRAIRKLSVNG